MLNKYFVGLLVFCTVIAAQASNVPWLNQPANTFLAAPNGSSGNMSARAMVSADLPVVPITKGGTGQTTQTSGFDALSPLTTKGDSIWYSGTHNVRVAACADGDVIEFDSTQANGIKCVAVGGGTVTNVTASAPITSSGGATPNIALTTPLALVYGGTHADLSATGGAHQVLRQSVSGANVTVSQLACGDLSDSTASCSTDTTNANNITSGTLALARGGTHADLSATGGAHQVLRQSASGANVSVSQLACADLSDSTASCSTDATNASNLSSGTVPIARATFAAQAIGASNIDWSTGNVFTKTLGANTTVTFSNQTSGQTIVVRLTQASSSYTVTWPAVKWAGGTAPTMTTCPACTTADAYTFFFDGTNTYGSVVQDMH